MKFCPTKEALPKKENFAKQQGLSFLKTQTFGIIHKETPLYLQKKEWHYEMRPNKYTNI